MLCPGAVFMRDGERLGDWGFICSEGLVKILLCRRFVAEVLGVM